MTPVESHEGKVRRGWLRRIAGWLLRGLRFLVLALVLAWGSLALYFSPLPWAEVRIGARCRLCGVRHLGHLADAPAARALGLCRPVPRTPHRVEFHPPLARSRMAQGRGGDAAGHHRRRPGAHHRRAQFRLPQPGRFHGTVRRARSLAVAPGRAGFLHLVLDAGARGPHVRELHLRQRTPAQHLHRDAAGSARGLRPAGVALQEVRADLRRGRRARHRRRAHEFP